MGRSDKNTFGMESGKMAAWAIAKVIDYYERRLEALEDRAYSDFWADEVLLVLNARDELNDRWAELSSEQRERVYILDDRLVKKHKLIAKHALPNSNVQDRTRWWWYLHEGPQVREQASAYPTK